MLDRESVFLVVFFTICFIVFVVWVVGFWSNIMPVFIGLVFELGIFLFILRDVCLWIFMAFDLA